MVYLLHLHEPMGRAQHYIGWAKTKETYARRIAHHRRGTGARFTQAAVRKGISFEVARVWPEGNRALELALKRKKKARLFCPVCLAAVQKDENIAA